MMTPAPAIVIDALSAQIAQAITEFEMESNYPSADADRMDAKIKHAQQRRDALRAIRQQYEDLMFGAVL